MTTPQKPVVIWVCSHCHEPFSRYAGLDQKPDQAYCGNCIAEFDGLKCEFEKYISLSSLRAFLKSKILDLEKDIYESQVEASKPIAVKFNIDIELKRQQQVMAIVRDEFHEILTYLNEATNEGEK